jgi:hypothetical protein
MIARPDIARAAINRQFSRQIRASEGKRMPVVECRCGLVTSVSNNAGIVRCIRCGRMQTRVEGTDQGAAICGIAKLADAADRPLFVPSTVEANRLVWPSNAAMF